MTDSLLRQIEGLPRYGWDGLVHTFTKQEQQGGFVMMRDLAALLSGEREQTPAPEPEVCSHPLSCRTCQLGVPPRKRRRTPVADAPQTVRPHRWAADGNWYSCTECRMGAASHPVTPLDCPKFVDRRVAPAQPPAPTPSIRDVALSCQRGSFNGPACGIVEVEFGHFGWASGDKCEFNTRCPKCKHVWNERLNVAAPTLAEGEVDEAEFQRRLDTYLTTKNTVASRSMRALPFTHWSPRLQEQAYREMNLRPVVLYRSASSPSAKGAETGA